MISTFLDLTIRVGCHLTYEATAQTPVVFMLRPRLDDAHLVTVEKRSFEPGFSSNEFQDSHSNLACRSMLKPGRNDIRYDALVAVSSTPENQGAPGVSQSAGCDWVHNNIEYRYGLGRRDLSASEVIEQRYGGMP